MLCPLLDLSMRSDGAHSDIADVIAKYMKDKIYYDCKAKCWFYIDHSNKWKSDTEAAFIPNLCKTSICRLFTEQSVYWSKMAQNSQG
jgi:hypothetical protein